MCNNLFGVRRRDINETLYKIAAWKLNWNHGNNGIIFSRKGYLEGVITQLLKHLANTSTSHPYLVPQASERETESEKIEPDLGLHCYFILYKDIVRIKNAKVPEIAISMHFLFLQKRSVESYEKTEHKVSYTSI
jgi:hypothetical protein